MTSPSTAAVATLRRHGITGPVPTAIVTGTGLGGIADAIEDAVVVSYADLPGFPAGGVSGHAGRLVVGSLDGANVAVMQGRAHYYETGDPRAMAVPIETLAALGVRDLVLTNSAGSTRVDWPPGTVVAVSDHINFAGVNPLIGTGGDDRFVPMAGAYDPGLLGRLRRAATGAGLADLPDGVYMWFAGPSFETPAEVRVARLLGADLVGMSTVPEVILARRLGLTVAALSVVTNFATGLAGGEPSHADTKQVAQAASVRLTRLLEAFVRAGNAASR